MLGNGSEPAEAKLAAALELSRRLLREKLYRGPVLTSSGETKLYLATLFVGQEYESFIALYLTNQHCVIKEHVLFRGTIDGAAVYPREVVREALGCNAAACIFAHNHPSGVAEPSRADIKITRKLQAALGTVDIRVLDHVVVGSLENLVSFAERGLL
ncbi:MAG: DNA repair protein RadC [Gammaproteobacteria bacterium]